MECWLPNAAHMKAVTGRKTDVKDAECIAQLLDRGLVRPSLVPAPPICRLRLLMCYRVQLMGDRSRDAGRSEKMLEDASFKISSVASSVTTVPARAMLAALIAGEADPQSWGALCHRAGQQLRLQPFGGFPARLLECIENRHCPGDLDVSKMILVPRGPS